MTRQTHFLVEILQTFELSVDNPLSVINGLSTEKNRFAAVIKRGIECRSIEVTYKQRLHKMIHSCTTILLSLFGVAYNYSNSTVTKINNCLT